MSETKSEKIPHLKDIGNVVPEGYTYYEKQVTSGEDLNLPNVYLKWYDISHPDKRISQEQAEESRAFVKTEIVEARLLINGELGFAILHHCGSALLLLLTTWRNTNEMWESVYAKDLTQAGGYKPILFADEHRATYCVWELGPVWHERQAWVRYLRSSRDEKAKHAYLNDRFTDWC
ncbi:hypothetical protein EPA93_27035 [Ktedonosporobacter rubrisoli]|uniref:Uncharacterized protein n=1 Tax=Ktedonosporobacter rubrisoli TaxID=2509675 RepID=A0A4P6JVQ6_KTERU|nr:hypothetical protein [Ktedonosporobacter rubrisoli]QBD79442.1 hypothetical protein EPA93_27035 [Ktedonosporobacter rubrisoli]